MTDPDNDRLRNRVARLLLLASEARATGRHAAADQFTERAAELLDQIVREELAKSPESATNKIGSLGQRAMERNGLDAATKPSNFFVIRSGRKRNGSDQNADQALPKRGRFF